LEQLSAAIVGLGRIGQLLDEGLDAATHCLTHSQAFSSHPDFKLIAGVDPNADLRTKFSTRFSSKAFASLNDLPKETRLDVISVAGPTNQNFQIFKQAIELKPKLILMEKPLGSDVSQAHEILRISKSAGVSVAVNFMRRAEPGVLEVQKLISSGQIGKIQKATVTYSKGLLNNGSHFVDLMRFWLGASSHHQILGSLNANFEGDPEPDFGIRFGNVPVYFLSGREEYYSLRDIQIFGSTAAISYLRGGQKIEVTNVVESQLYRGYRFLSFDGRELSTQINRVQYFVADQISNYLRKGTALNFDGSSALLTMEDVERVRTLCLTH